MASSNLKTTELDFDQIKLNLKNYLKQQTEFSDYDFDGSGLSVLLDVLAYNTHYNAMTAHLALSEAFLDSAQIRGNVVTRAKMLGYTPRSVLAPRATVNIVVNVTSEVGTIPTTLSLPRGTKLTTLVDGEEFNYIVLATQTATLVTASSPVSKTYTFSNVEIAEGTYKTMKFRVDNDIVNQKYQIPDSDVDTSTLRVRVQANEESSSFDIYTKFASLLTAKSDTKIYHLQENSNEYYEIYFGDNVIGFKPSNNNIITLDYLYSNGPESNGAKTFTVADNIGGFSNTTATIVSAATGGADSETTESIRYNAPLTFTSQKRAVTSDDYRSIILGEFSNISAISTWGGEDNDPPDYGKIYICIKPVSANVLTNAEKADITTNILKGKNVVSITPEIVNPNFTFLELDVAFKYNPNLTDRTSVELTSVVRDTIDDFSLNDLNKFDGVFRHSSLLKDIDKADPAILNSTVRPFLFQTITPSTVVNNHDLVFTGSFFVPTGLNQNVIASTAFKLSGDDHFFGDEAISASTKRNVYVYKLVSGVEVKVIADAGEIDPTKGTITLNNFVPDDTTAIRITVIPNSLDIAPKRDQLLSIDNTRVTISADEDTIAVSGSAGTIDYTTTTRFRTS
ncbi:hypothetical protein CBD41_08720 [bacterium TMED181]|nr:MAG: hypothetical protein CBD41_08720 [bacterium TMED181]